jgi:hypothetical protein
MRASAFALAIAVLVTVPAVARAATPTVVDEHDVRLLLEKGRFTAEQSQAALALLDRASRAGLPASMLVNRIREGIARRAEPRAILGVVQDRLTQLERADDVVRRCAQRGVAVRDRDRSLLTLADAFAQGVTPGDVLELAPAAGRRGTDIESVARAAEVMGHLARKGFPPRDTREAVSVALGSAWPPDRMQDLVGLFLRADALRLPPDEAREHVLDEVREQTRAAAADDRKRESEVREAKGETTGRGSEAARSAQEERREHSRTSADAGERDKQEREPEKPKDKDKEPEKIKEPDQGKDPEKTKEPDKEKEPEKPKEPDKDKDKDDKEKDKDDKDKDKDKDKDDKGKDKELGGP